MAQYKYCAITVPHIVIIDDYYLNHVLDHRTRTPITKTCEHCGSLMKHEQMNGAPMYFCTHCVHCEAVYGAKKLIRKAATRTKEKVIKKFERRKELTTKRNGNGHS